MKIGILFFVALFGFSSLCLAQNEKFKYIGYKYKGVLVDETLPNGVKHLGGGLITESKPTYGVSEMSKGATRMLWLDKATGEDETGVTGWEVKDVLAFPAFGKNQELLFSYSGCQRNKKSDNSLVVFADFSPRQKTYKVRRAWLANVKTEKFEEIPIKGVQCAYEEP